MDNYSVRHSKNASKKIFWNDGVFTVGLVFGFFVCSILVLFLMFLSEFNQRLFLDSAPILVSLLVAGASTFLASKALFEQKKTREAATDPVLVAHFGQREDARECITFKVSNIGAGAALNIRICVLEPENANLENKEILVNIFEPFHPIAVILQGESVEFSFAIGHQILGQSPLPPFESRIIYQDLNANEYEGKFSLDVREMKNLGAHRTPQMRVVKALESISNKI